MPRSLALSFAVLLLASGVAAAQVSPRMVVAAPPPPPLQSELGGGFIEFLFGAHNVATPVAPPPAAHAAPPVIYGAPPPAPPPAAYAAPPVIYGAPPPAPPRYANAAPVDPMLERGSRYRMDPQFLRQQVDYHGKEAPGTVVVDTPHHFLYLVEPDGKAMRYGIGVARTGFSWSGVHTISAKKEWPDWIPPKEMLARQPYLPRRMAGGPNNPLGARALYIGSTLYRIHGSNEPWTIGHNVSSGCIRLRNADVIDLYQRVNVGTKVVVIGPNGSDRDYIPTSSTSPPQPSPEGSG